LNFDIGEVLNKDILNLRNLLYSLILKITGRMPIFVEGPECVFFSLWKKKKGKIYIVHLVNELSPQGRPASREKMRTEIIPVDIKIFIDIPGFKEIRKIVGEGNLEIKNGGREIFIRGMKERVILTIKF
jgi:hypothetical protein